MTEIAALGLKADSSSLVVATEDLKKLSRAAGEAEQAAGGLAKGTDRLRDANGRFTPSGKQATDQVEKLGKESRTTEGALHRLAERAGTVAGSLVAMATAAFSVGAYVKLADSWSDMRSTLGAAIGDMDAASGMMNRMLEIAQASYSPLDQTVQMYARNVAVLRDLGKNAGQAADFTESLNHMLVITATKGERAASVQDALSKAMATGRLQADGLETVLANGGRVAQALADELGTTVSGLRDFASQGKITGQVIADAIIKPLEDVRDVAGSMDATVADGFTKVGNSLLALVGNFDQATGASLWFATQLDDLSKWLTALSQTDFAAWADTATAALTLMGQAVLVLAATRIPALIGAMLTLAPAITAVNASNTLMVAGFVAMRVQALAAAVATRTLGAAIALVGGPLGIAAAGAAALVLAFYNSRSVYETATSATDAYKVAQEGLNGALQNFHESQSQQTLRALQEAAKGALDAAAEVVKAQEALLQAAQAQAGGTLGIGMTGGIVTQAMLDEDTARIAAAQEALAAARNALIQASFDYTASMATVVDGTVAAASATAQLTAEQQKVLASALEMERSYRDRAALAQIEAQHGRDSAQYMSEQLSQERAIQHAKINSLDISNQQKSALRDQYDEMMRLEAKTRGWAVEIGKVNGPLSAAYDWLVKIRDTQPGEGWLSTAISKAAGLAAALWDAVAGMGALTATAVDDAGNPIVPGVSRGMRPQRPGVDSYGDWLNAGSSGGGGGGGGSDRQSALESLITEFATERELIEEWYGTRQALINEYTDQELDFLGGKHGAIERLEVEHRERLRALGDQERQTRVEEYAGMYEGLAAVAAIGGRRALKAQATLSAAATMIAGYEAAMKAAAEAKTIPGRIAAYAKFVGMAVSAAQSIRQAGGGGGSSGGASAGGSSSAATTSQTQSQPQDVILDFSATADPAMRALANALMPGIVAGLQKVSKTGVNVIAFKG